MKHSPYRIDLKALDKAIDAHCKYAGTTRTAIAEAAGVDSATMTRLKQGKHHDLSATTFVNLLLVLDRNHFSFVTSNDTLA
jgi:DNA-binding Xre family transcriptional regulator